MGDVEAALGRMPEAWIMIYERMRKVQDKATRLMGLPPSELAGELNPLEPDRPGFAKDHLGKNSEVGRAQSDVQKLLRLVRNIEEHPAYATDGLFEDISLLLRQFIKNQTDASSGAQSSIKDYSRLSVTVDLSWAASPKAILTELHQDGRITFPEYAGMLVESELASHLWLVHNTLCRLEAALKLPSPPAFKF